jgi:hypothetical protein
METKAFTEYLGDIDTEALLQDLSKTNEHFSGIDALRRGVPRGFKVIAEIERPEGAPVRLARLILEPK